MYYVVILARFKDIFKGADPLVHEDKFKLLHSGYKSIYLGVFRFHPLKMEDMLYLGNFVRQCAMTKRFIKLYYIAAKHSRYWYQDL